MSEIDDKLWDILTATSISGTGNIEGLVRDIKQAFTAAGYVDATALLKVSDLLVKQADELLKMTQLQTNPVLFYDEFGKLTEVTTTASERPDGEIKAVENV